MIYNYNNFNLLLESKRKDQLKNKYVTKLGMTEPVFDDLYNKNAEWLMKTYMSTTKEKKQEIEDTTSYSLNALLLKYATMFDNNKDNLSIKNISDVDGVDSMNELLDEIREFDSAKDTFGDDIWILKNDYEWFIFKAFTYEASQLANNKKREYNWCTN